MGTILVAEADADIRQLIGVVLRREGHQVLEAERGLDAVLLAERHLPDLVMLNIIDPHLSGWEAAARLKSDSLTGGIAVLALTTRALTRLARAAGLAPFDAVVMMPFDVGELLAHVRRLVSRERGACA